MTDVSEQNVNRPNGSDKNGIISPHCSPSPCRNATAVVQQRIGPYILGKTLGVGSTGRVKAATHLETNHKVAIKIINKDPSLDKPDKKLEREITIMKLIQQYVVLFDRSHDIVPTFFKFMMFMKVQKNFLEQVEGGELFDYLVKRGRLTEAEALYFFQQIICGVEYCHRHLICHRDLKPENLLLDKEFNVKVADFGMANLQVPTKMLETSCGSPHYASPEIIKGEKYDGPTSDVWSCGIILYALLTGSLPFDDENIRKLLNKVKIGHYHVPEHISPSAKDLLQKMLTVDPNMRPSLREVMAHPWFNSKEPKNAITLAPSPFETNAFERGYPDTFNFEADLLEALHFLGWTDKEQLISNLKAEKNNPEKVFYNLLSKRKWTMLENYNADKDKYDVEGGPLRRQDSTDIDTIHKRAPTDLPKKETVIENVRRVASEGSPISTRSIAAKKAFSPLSNAETNSEIEITKSVDSIEEENREKETDARKPKGARRKGPLAINTGDSVRQVGDAGLSSASSAKILTGGLKSPGITQAFASLTVSTPRFHRKGMLLDSAPMSPVVSSTPKTSWFNGLFNFKPEMYYLISSKTLDNTQAKLEQILQKLTIVYKVLGPGHLKCKLHENEGDSFKIEIVPNDAEKKLEDNSAGDLRVQFIHKQGAFSMFQSLVRNIQADWEIENREPSI